MSTVHASSRLFSSASSLSASVAGGVLLSLLLALCSARASAAVPAANAELEAADIENELTERELAETANYSDGEISIDYPVSWQVSVSESGEVSIVETAPDVANDGAALPAPPTEPQEILVETQVFRVAAPPGPLVDANIDSFIDEGAAVSRYTSVEIDDQDALVIWLADRPNELSSAIATFIGYGDETIFLFSRYSPDNESAENSILRLHSSFTNLRPNLMEPDRSSRPPSDTAAPSAQPPRPRSI